MNQEEITLEDLQIEHGKLETRLMKLGRIRTLSAEEAYELQVIKKRKLALKDRMGELDKN